MASHTRAMRSEPDVTTVRPSGEQASDRTRPPGFALARSGRAVGASQTRTAESPQPVASDRPSGANDTAVTEPMRESLLKVVREALSNVSRHAQATRVELALGTDEGRAVLTIRDDGIGFDPEVVATQRTARGTSGGFGLIGIRERAQLMGGTSDIWSDVGAGTRIIVRVPIQLVN